MKEKVKKLYEQLENSALKEQAYGDLYLNYHKKITLEQFYNRLNLYAAILGSNNFNNVKRYFEFADVEFKDL
jgi:hypothetical protein